MMWNELSPEFQKFIVNRIIDLVFQESDENIKNGYMAAITELEMWSHLPEEFEQYVAEAKDCEL